MLKDRDVLVRANAEQSLAVWPADKVERWPIERLIPYARNARTHSAEQVDQIAASIREWGWTNPVLVSEDGTIIAGHGRVLGASKLGIAEVAGHGRRPAGPRRRSRPTRSPTTSSALNAGWDEELLALEIGELQELGFDLDLIGFSADEIAALGVERHRGPDRSGRGAGAAGGAGLDAGRSLAARPPPAAVRRQHVGGGCREGARRRAAAPDGHRPALWRRLRSGLARRRRASSRTSSGSARSPTTTAPTGARPGRCSPARSPTSGTPAATPARCRSR